MKNFANRAALNVGVVIAMSVLVTSGYGQSRRGSRHNYRGTASRGGYVRGRGNSAVFNYSEIVGRYSAQNHVDPRLVFAVMMVESGGDPSAVSSSGALGLMQLMPGTCTDYGVTNPYDPEDNIRGGTELLAADLKRYRGNMKKAIAAYNAGPRRVDDGSWVHIAETRRYVPKVLAQYAALVEQMPLQSSPDSAPSNPPPAAEPPADSSQPAGPAPIPVVDGMYETIRKSQLQFDPEGVAENGVLDNAADSVLQKVLLGKVEASAAGALVGKWLSDSHFKHESLATYCFTTGDDHSFSAGWDLQKKAPGRFVGLAHAESPRGHVWLVILATKR